MVSLLDISDAPATEVEIRGIKVPVVGLSIRDIARLLSQFDQLRGMVDDDRDITANDMLAAAPDAIGAIGAAGVGEWGNKEVEEKVRSLKAGEQIRLLTAIINESFGDELGPLLAKAREWIDTRVAARKTGANDAAAPGKERPSPSQLPSKASLQSGTTPEMFGGTAQGNSPDLPS